MANNKLVDREVLKAFRQKLQKYLEEGNIIPYLALYSKYIEPISEESGDTQESPFIMEAAGTNNNSTETTVGSYAKQLEKQGNTVCVNQQVQNGNFASTSNWSSSNATFTVSSNVANLVYNIPSGSNNTIYLRQTFKGIVGHKYLFLMTAKGLNNDNSAFYVGTTLTTFSITTTYQLFSYIFTYSSGETIQIFRRVGNDISNTINIKNAMCIDLTQWFNGNIPQDLLDNPSHWSWYQNFGDYIAYNAGTLDDCSGRYIQCGQSRQLWDEEVENGIINAAGQLVDEENGLRSKNFSYCMPNTKYYSFTTINSSLRICWYDKNKVFIKMQDFKNTNLTSPENARYFKLSLSSYGTTYNHDITISQYFTTGVDYNKYYPYVAPKTYDTGTEVLRRIPVASGDDIFDTKAPDGTITRRVGIIRMKDISWNISENKFYSNIGSYGFVAKGNFFNNNYNHVETPYSSLADKCITSNNTGLGNAAYIIVRDSSYNDTTSFKNHFTDNDYLYFELKENSQTTEQGTPFIENLGINDYSYIAWFSAYTDETTNTLVDIPQGCKLFYPFDYVSIVDDLATYLGDNDADVNDLVLKSDLSFKELDAQYIGAITSTQVTTGFYKNEIAISGGLDNAKYVSALMSNGNLYPMMKSTTNLVVFNGLSFQGDSITVSKVYYKE